MAGTSITTLKPMLDPRYQLAPGIDLETLEAARRESVYRSVSLRKIAAGCGSKSKRRAALELADHLAGMTLSLCAASPIGMHQMRLRVPAHLRCVLDRPDVETPKAATVIGRGMRLSPKELQETTAYDLKRQLRADLYNVGAAVASGVLFAGLHGAYDLSTGNYMLHWHLVATGGMIDVVDALRYRPKYRSSRNNPDDVSQRVRLSRIYQYELVKALTYLVQSFWSCRWVGEDDHGSPTRLVQRRRIPEPFHSQYLLWLSRQSLTDLTLMIHLKVVDGQLMPSRG